MTMSHAVPFVCAYCGLPVPRSSWFAVPSAQPAYCCYGCRFAANVSASEGEGAEAQWMFTRLGLAIFCTVNVMAFTMALWSGDVYGEDDSVVGRSLHGIFRYLSMLFALPVFWTLGLPLLENAWDSLKRGIANIDVLLVAGVAASFAYSVHSVFRDEGPIYFEVGCAVLVLVTLGRWLEATGKAGASQALAQFEQLLPETVCVIGHHREEEKPLGRVALGECLRVRAGERIPCDGVLLGQAAHLDEQLLTGESAARTKEPGETVYAGTLNLDCDLKLRVTSLPQEGALSRLVRLVRQAQEAKGRYEQFADRVARWFLPLVAIAALATAGYHGMTQDPTTGVLAGLSVVLIACPCALGIATPLAMWTALGQAARHRVLFHSGEALERLAAVQHVCFDKTGTLTTGTPIVERVVLAAGEDAPACYQIGVSLAWGSRHVYAHAIAAFLRERFGVVGDPSIHVETRPGRGVICNQDCERTVALGSERWMAELGMWLPDDVRLALDAARQQGRAFVCLAWDQRVRCVFILAENWRPEAAPTMRALKDARLDATILTGDHASAAAEWARSHVIDTRIGLLPEEKLDHLRNLRDQGQVVAMVGDGVNDGPALAGCDVGIALGCGADVARDAASVCLLDNDLGRIPWAITLAQRTVRVIQQNLLWAFAYNIAGIGLACVGQLNPVVAALAMTASSLFVVANSMRLRG